VWVMINLVLGKALQNQNDPMIYQLIHKMPRLLIVEHTGNDDKWGDGSKLDPSILGPGENRLGLIWGAVQTTLKDYYQLPIKLEYSLLRAPKLITGLYLIT
ncbi:MAG: hypothetical protein Q8R43_02070, partial [Alphaproteobacteria bacterium]|nr:hypothetical protein [Alphaproteobacteria bacterium]